MEEEDSANLLNKKGPSALLAFQNPGITDAGGKNAANSTN